ncbi:MAG: hypothetical protein AAFN81_03640 [Bacteroidota bacterium]
MVRLFAISLTVFLVYSLPFALSAQADDATAILQSAWEDERYQAYQRELDFFTNQNALNIPRLEELEFRTETHEFNPQLQEYALRLQLNSSRQIKVQERINQQEYSLLLIRQEAYLEELLFQRYQFLIDIRYQQQHLALLESRIPVMEDWERVIQARIQADGERHYSDWLELEDDRLELQQQAQLLQQQLQAGRQQYTFWTEQTTNRLAVGIWPRPSQLEKNWLVWQNDTLVVPLNVQEQQLTSSLVELELAAEQAEERNRLNFLQLRYQGEDEDRVLREQVTLGAGITLPFRSANSVKAQYLKLEQIEEENQELERQRRWLQKLQDAEANMAIQVIAYQQLETALNDYESRFGTAALQSRGITRPETYLQATMGVLERQALLLEQEKQLYEAYLDVLLLSGRLIAKPYRNWLSDIQTPLRQ